MKKRGNNGRGSGEGDGMPDTPKIANNDKNFKGRRSVWIKGRVESKIKQRFLQRELVRLVVN